MLDGHAGTTAVLCMLDLAGDELLRKRIIIADSEHCLALLCEVRVNPEGCFCAAMVSHAGLVGIST